MGLSKNLHAYTNGNGFKCYYCDNPIEKSPVPEERWRTATRDHKVPKVRGGSDQRLNIVLACSRCNGAKSDMTCDEFTEFKKSGKLAASYITYLEGKLRKTLGIDR